MTGIAKLVSAVLHPLCMPLLTLGLLLATDGYLAHRLGLFAYLFVLLLINTLAPALSMFILKKRGVISDWDIRMRHERRWPFLLVLAYYLMAYVLVVNSTAVEGSIVLPKRLALARGGHCVCLGGHLEGQNQHAHARPRGIMGVYLHVAMTDQMWSLGWVSLLVLGAGLVGWSRLHLSAHTPGQVYAGYVLGVTTVWITLF